jgi:hypothetical protein
MRLDMVVLLGLVAGSGNAVQLPDAKQIIQKSVEANERDFQADPNFNFKERDRDADGDKTYQVTIIEGSPYQRLIAVEGKPLSPAEQQKALRKEAEVRKQRHAESASERQKRIAKYERERQRDHAMMGQLTEAFNFTVVGPRNVRDRAVWVLRATQKRGYRPPNRDTQVLTGMQGELWIDQKTNQWLRVTAQVLHPVSIEGFLARVLPGTRFELEKAPVGDESIWLPVHFSEHASAKVLGVFNHREQQDNTFWDYQPAK